ncbi:MAG: sorbosone dehydrogenase family protein [Chitinophagaceae bacterium]
MKKITNVPILFSFVALVLFSGNQSSCDNNPAQPAAGRDELFYKYDLDKIVLPPGFKISVFAEVPNARSMCLGDQGTLFVGNREKDKVYAVRDENKDGVAEKVYVLASGLRMPCGVAFRNGSLYVAEVSRILRYDNIESRLDNPPAPVVVYDKLPADRHHGWKYISFGPDGKLYVPVGAPCNVCEGKDSVYASIARMNPDGTGFELFASGIRNSVGFDWHPQTKELWFTENGRDNMGDNIPGDELNRAPVKGLHFGFPYCHQGNTPDPEFGKGKRCEDYTAPERVLDPHVAAIGMRFYTGDMFLPEYKNQIFIAEHGSWNRSEPIGYRIMLVRLENNKPVQYVKFAHGWLQDNGKVLGRPADVQVAPDGALLVSDDSRGAIYRIVFEK